MFEEAEAIWDGPMFREEHVTALPENRWAVIGRMGKSAHLAAAIAYQGGRVRSISAGKRS